MRGGAEVGPDGAYVPGGHTVHAGWPIWAWYAPPGHLLQLVDLFAPANIPAKHAAQLLDAV